MCCHSRRPWRPGQIASTLVELHGIVPLTQGNSEARIMLEVTHWLQNQAGHDRCLRRPQAHDARAYPWNQAEPYTTASHGLPWPSAVPPALLRSSGSCQGTQVAGWRWLRSQASYQATPYVAYDAYGQPLKVMGRPLVTA